MAQLPIFDELDNQQQQQSERYKELMAQPIDCIFCGERYATAASAPNNHGIVFNGWCIKALMYHARCQGLHTEEARWLQIHGIDPEKSRFDESHWNKENIKNHYDDHFGRCYTRECRGIS